MIGEILLLIICVISLSGGIFAMVSYRDMQPAYRWIGIYLLAVGLIQFVAVFIINKVFHDSNTSLYNFAIFFYQITLFMVFYYLSERKIARNVVIRIFGISTLVIGYILISQVSAYQVSMKAIVFGSFVFAVCAMLYLLDFMLSDVAENPIKNSRFVALSGILFYFSASGVFFAGREMLQEFAGQFYNYINLVLMLLFYSILTFVIYMNKKRNLSNDLN